MQAYLNFDKIFEKKTKFQLAGGGQNEIWGRSRT